MRQFLRRMDNTINTLATLIFAFAVYPSLPEQVPIH